MITSITASLSSPKFSYVFDKDADPNLLVYHHRETYPDRLKVMPHSNFYVRMVPTRDPRDQTRRIYIVIK